MQRSYRDFVSEVGTLGELDCDLDRGRAGSDEHVDRLALQSSSRRCGEGVAHCFADQVVTEGQPTFVFGNQLSAQKLVDRLEQRRRQRVEHLRHLVEREPWAEHGCDTRCFVSGVGQTFQPFSHGVGEARRQPVRHGSGLARFDLDEPVLLQPPQQFDQQEWAALRTRGQLEESLVGLGAEDVRAIFSDMKIDPPHKTMGQIKHESRIDRVEDLPKPIRCLYQTSRTDLVNGERRFVTHAVNLIVSNMAATPELSKKFYEVARKVGDAKTEIDGLGDEASLSVMNAIYIRKGLLTVEIRVGGEDRDRALHDDATRRVNELAKLVAAKLP